MVFDIYEGIFVVDGNELRYFRVDWLIERLQKCKIIVYKISSWWGRQVVVKMIIMNTAIVLYYRQLNKYYAKRYFQLHTRF